MSKRTFILLLALAFIVGVTFHSEGADESVVSAAVESTLTEGGQTEKAVSDYNVPCIGAAQEDVPAPRTNLTSARVRNFKTKRSYSENSCSPAVALLRKAMVRDGRHGVTLQRVFPSGIQTDGHYLYFILKLIL